MKGYMKKYKDWIGGFLSNLLATVLGIVLTFGTTWWIERSRQVDAAEETVERCLANMERRGESLEGLVKMMISQDSILQVVTSRWPDVSDDTLSLFKDVFGSSNFTLHDHSAESVFKGSYENAHILGRFAENLRFGFEYLDWMEQRCQHVEDLRQETLRQILTDPRFSSTQTDREKVRLMLDMPEVRYFILQHGGWANSLEKSLPVYQEKILPFLHKLWNGEVEDTEIDFSI